MPDRTITEADAEAIAEHMTAKLIERLSDKETVEQITDAWSGYVDRHIGRGLRRLGLYVVVAAIGVAALKLDVLKFLVK